MVEKIKRDVRITMIYEGTSEIMEMTIARDRWQEHLKTRGDYYHDMARELEACVGDDPAVGADVAALALACAWPSCSRRAGSGHLTRNQHVLLRLGELIAYAEGAGALARRAAAAAAGALPEKADTRLHRGGARRRQPGERPRRRRSRSPTEGLRWVSGADARGRPGRAPCRWTGCTPRRRACWPTSNQVADALYGREA